MTPYLKSNPSKAASGGQNRRKNELKLSKYQCLERHNEHHATVNLTGTAQNIDFQQQTGDYMKPFNSG